jgi:phosphoribosylamine--glycine ligase
MQSIYKMKRVLVLGSGGREHAFVYALSKSPLLDKLYCAPGNPGTALLAENVPLKISDFKAIASLIKDENIDIVVVGPENPLVDGLRDYLEEEGILERTIFVGPGRDGAQLEGSKEFAKEFMKRWSVPTAAYNTYSKEGIGDAFIFLKPSLPLMFSKPMVLLPAKVSLFRRQ